MRFEVLVPDASVNEGDSQREERQGREESEWCTETGRDTLGSSVL